MKRNAVIDSSGWVEFFTDGPKAAAYAPHILRARPETHFTPAVVLFEVYRKIKRERGEEPALDAVAHIEAHTRVVPLDGPLALRAADTGLRLGLTMADAVVLATAEAHDAELFTGDADFRGVEGATVL